jgi:pentatricopeptide repeat protein
MAVDGCLLNSCTHNLIIQGFLRNGDTSNAVQLIEEMAGRGLSADSSTFQMLLDLESYDEIIRRFLHGNSQGRKMK